MALIDDIQGYWKYDESSGNAADSTPNNNDLTNNNTATYAAAVINNGCDIELGSNQWFSIADASQTGLDFSDALTFAGWMKPESTDDPGGVFVNKRTGAGTRAYTFSKEGLNEGLHFTSFTDGTNVGVDGFRSTTFNTGTWYHVAVTKSGVTVKFYVDGSQLGTDLTGSNGTIANTSAPFIMGGIADGNSYDGMLDEWGVWSRALSGSEIAELYNSGAGLSYPFAAAAVEGRNTNLSLLGVGQ